MDPVTLGMAKADAAKKYQPAHPRLGNNRIRSMIGASVLASPPTITAQTTSVWTGFDTFISPSWTGFRISGAPLINNSGSYYPRNARKTDDSFSSWGGCLRVEFDADSQVIVFRSQVPANAYFRIWVNEQPHSSGPVLLNSISGVSGTGSHSFKVDFGTRAYRRIQLEFTSLSTSPAAFGGLYRAPTDTVAPPTIPSPVVCFIHDSYGFGVGATWTGDAWPIMASRLLGWSAPFNFTAVPSTGVVKTNAGNLYGNYSSRFTADVIPLAPDVVFYCGSVNDGASLGLITAQATADLTALKAALPRAQIIVTSPIYTAAPTAAHLSVSTEMAAAATAARLTYINLVDTTIAYFTGTGHSGAVAGNGNSDYYSLDVSGYHPTTAGALAIGRFIAAKAGPVLGQTAT